MILVRAQVERVGGTEPGTARRWCDALAEVICRDIAHFTEVVTERAQGIDGVVSIESFFVLEDHELAYGWGVGDVPGLLDADGR